MQIEFFIRKQNGKCLAHCLPQAEQFKENGGNQSVKELLKRIGNSESLTFPKLIEKARILKNIKNPKI